MAIGRSFCRAVTRDRWRAAAALLALAALLTVRVPRSSSLRADFPQHSPSTLAHFLADFSNHPRLYSHITGSWGVEEEMNNYTSWRYVVSYECGARCAGRVELSAHDDASQHRVQVRDAWCSKLPLLPWPQICQTSLTETVITSRSGGGALMEEVSRVQCGALALALAAGCDAAAARRQHLRALRAELARQL
ncbi:uncharacterized protein LOC124529863 [Vanessa cardui]|uniref:uncharacterized protein LOC124529863 n=1 Tax=Vanessa cardui TaxID=171605 RepID=UPI001F13F5BD|nr:uncharacterized protein LOC124529863 [Vanessa cardui]